MIKWIVERVNGTARARDSAIGRVPLPGDLDLSGLSINDAAFAELMTVDAAAWREEAAANGRDLAKFGALPAELTEQQHQLEARVAA